jgi:hypothetical protein
MGESGRILLEEIRGLEGGERKGECGEPMVVDGLCGGEEEGGNGDLIGIFGEEGKSKSDF